MPDLHDEPSEATSPAPAPAPATAQAPAPAVAPATAPVSPPITPQAGPTGDAKADAQVDHYAAIAAIVPEAQLDVLAARVIASGGVAGVTFQPDDGGPSSSHADLGSHASAIQQELQQSADSFVEAQGVNVADFHKYVRAQGSGVLNSTALLLWHSRSPDVALRPLLQEFRRTSAHRNRK
jgi:hypothetical protein